MRLGIDATYLLTGERTGVETYTLHLLAALLELPDRPETYLYAAGAAIPADAAPLLNAADRRRLSENPRLWLRARMPLRMWLDRVQVAHFPGTLLPGWLPCPAVTTFYDLAALRYPQLYDPADLSHYEHLIPSAARRSGAILAISECTANDLAAAFQVDRAKVFVAPPGVDPKFRPVPGAADQVARRFGLQTPYVLAIVGSGHPRKNLVAVVEAMAQPGVKGLTLAIVGTAARDPLALEAIHGSPAREHIRLLGHVPQDDLPAIYSAAAAFLFPSLYEGFGLPVLEAMACGTPVICANTSSLPEAAGDAALLVDPLVPEQLPEALLRVLGDAALAAEMTGKGLARAAGFTWRRCAELTLPAYRYAARLL